MKIITATWKEKFCCRVLIFWRTRLELNVPVSTPLSNAKHIYLFRKKLPAVFIALSPKYVRKISFLAEERPQRAISWVTIFGPRIQGH